MSKCVVGVTGKVLVGAALAGLGGCGIQRAPILSPEAFVQNRPVIGPGVGQPVDRSGELVYDAEHGPQKVARERDPISPTVRDSTPAEPGLDAARTDNGSDFPPPEPFVPDSQAGQFQPGQFKWVGSVLAVVNGQAIYANKVISSLDHALATEARKGDLERFKVVATDMVSRQINVFVSNELQFAAAQGSLDRKDEQLARMITNKKRNEFITASGGSEAMARQRAADDGIDFDELMQQKFRETMTQLYAQRRIYPLIQVTSTDMRQYYQANLRDFQKPSAAQFRVIKIGYLATGGRTPAKEKAADVYKRATAGGEDFAELAGQINDDPSLKSRHGVVGDGKNWMEKGAYAVDKVDEAIWGMRAGDVSLPIDARDPIDRKDYYFLVKVDAMQPGVTEPFESEKVQKKIRTTLENEQYNKLLDKHRQHLMQMAVINENPNMRQIVLEMVMQKYPQWVAAR
ncbi:MAG: peptidylprolyl cis-trans isomerase, PpiC-type, SurA family [Phycisphaerales bacterium]|jgi:hypothetical protein|nr:peptidylprolyl cis-trans isomerase, PpiC-type, SurA family [Phycisphaerales bacterium]